MDKIDCPSEGMFYYWKRQNERLFFFRDEERTLYRVNKEGLPFAVYGKGHTVELMFTVKEWKITYQMIKEKYGIQ